MSSSTVDSTREATDSSRASEAGVRGCRSPRASRTRLRIASNEAVGDLPSLDDRQRNDLAQLLVDVLARPDQLFDARTPYMLWIHQRPSDGGDWPLARLHIEIVSPWRTKGVMRFVAAGELGSGEFFNTVEPETAAAQLRNLIEPHERRRIHPSVERRTVGGRARPRCHARDRAHRRVDPRLRASGRSPSGTHSGLDTVVPLGIIAERATGHPGRPGLVGSRTDGTAWSPRFVRRSAEVSAMAVTFELVDAVAELGLSLRLEVGEVLTISATLTNLGAGDYLCSVSPCRCRSPPMPRSC
ncbi:MAG: hypothetical protein R2710_07730 [Acidimicrobiales bacterium]